MNRTARTTLLCFLATGLLATGCKKKEAPQPAETAQPTPPPPAPLAVASVDLGKAVDASKRVTAPTTTFGVNDTIYASVGTTGAGTNASIGAKWSFVKASGGLISVNETSQTITTTDAVATEFHITNQKPWPKGKYRVEIQLNGAPAGTKDFDVQ
jgi:hypothetical protein